MAKQRSVKRSIATARCALMLGTVLVLNQATAAVHTLSAEPKPVHAGAQKTHMEGVTPATIVIHLADSSRTIIERPARTNVGKGKTTQPAKPASPPSSGRSFRPSVSAKPTGVQETVNRLRGYSALVAPNNPCTRLVIRVCGTRNQCASSPGCPPAKQLLQRYNQTGHSADIEASCNASLEDGIIFSACGR